MNTVGREKTGIFLDSIVSAPMTEQSIAAARKTVASNAVGVEDCALLLDMLGLNFEIDE